MTTEFTFEGTAASASSSVRWTVNRLKTHLVGEGNYNRHSDGGGAPDRLANLIREAAQSIWNEYDWRFRWKRGTLTTVASTETAAAASDFGELAQRWVRDPQASALRPIEFTEDPAQFQRFADRYDSTDSSDEGEPSMACIAQDTSQSTFTWFFYLSRIPDDAYTYPYWYLMADGWTLGTLDDDDVAPWPKAFDHGWYLRAKYLAQAAFSPGDRWQQTKGGYNKWLERTKQESNETMADPGGAPFEDHYQDLGGAVAVADPKRTGFMDQTWP